MDLFKTIYSRQTVRDFDSNETPTPEDITIILRAAMASPVGRSRYEDLHLTVITDKEWLKEMSNVVNAEVPSSRPNAPFYKVPIIILISSKLAENPAIEYTNAGCVVQNMALAARGLDLGSVILWSFVKHLKKSPSLLAKLELPEGMVPIIGLGVGYPAIHQEVQTRPRHIISVNKI
ncbi:MAG: nitroreductase family protein [Christensenellales bacterium]|jgi:nitroreductase|nr:hypothetical protein [Clostridiales bacterium]